MFFYREKSHADGVLTWGGQLDAQRGAFASKKLVWNLNQHARAIAVVSACYSTPARSLARQSSLMYQYDMLVVCIAVHRGGRASSIISRHVRFACQREPLRSSTDAPLVPRRYYLIMNTYKIRSRYD